MGWAHQGTEVENVVCRFQFFEKLLCMTACVDDAEDLGGVSDSFGQDVVGERRQRFYGDAFEVQEELVGAVDDLLYVLQAEVEIVTMLDGGLRGGAEDDRAVVVQGELTERFDAWAEIGCGERLGFVEDDHAAGNVVEFSATGRTIREERFEELDIGGYDDWSIPVFAGQTGAMILFVRFEVAVMFEDGIVAKDPAEYRSVLFDDAGERNDVNDAVEPVCDRMAEGKCQGRERFSAACWDSEREQAGLFCCVIQASFLHVESLAIHRRVWIGLVQQIKVATQFGPKGLQGWIPEALRGAVGVHELFGIEEICIDQR